MNLSKKKINIFFCLYLLSLAEQYLTSMSFIFNIPRHPFRGQMWMPRWFSWAPVPADGDRVPWRWLGSIPDTTGVPWASHLPERYLPRSQRPDILHGTFEIQPAYGYWRWVVASCYLRDEDVIRRSSDINISPLDGALVQTLQHHLAARHSQRHTCEWDSL